MNEQERKQLATAQNLVSTLTKADSQADRIELANMALKISKHCADAYILLAQEKPHNLAAKLNLLEKAVAVGESAISVEDFRSYYGEFWGFLQARPYMRARASLADCLWELGRREQSLDHLVDILTLNHQDDLGLRFIVVSRAIALNRLELAEKILTAYQDTGFADWAFNLALVEFIGGGAGKQAAQALDTAGQTNEFVMEMLAGRVEVSNAKIDGYKLGSKQEAIFYVRDNMENWQSTPGAIDWIKTYII